jgi:pimeloyl-ACP methyl ester carboxylesterase
MRRLFLATICMFFAVAHAETIMDKVEHHHVDNDGVRIHYVTMGEGPLLVLVHGFPDFWYSWRNQLPALAEHYRVAALDLRGFNESAAPAGQENYDMTLLVSDVLAVIQAEGAEKATVIGHDWGGAIAWFTAMTAPAAVERLVILNLPHPSALARELANNPDQQAASEYARMFQMEGAHNMVTVDMIASMPAQGDEDALEIYKEALGKSDMEAMLNYYKQNYPRPPYEEAQQELPPVQAPVLQFHGLDDPALLSSGLDGTWNWIDNTLTLVTIPGAGHWPHLDRPELVNETILGWLERN